MEHQTLSPVLWFIEQAKVYRKNFSEEIVGKFDDTLLAPNPQTRKIYDKERWTGYEVVLDVYPSLFAAGILLIPKDIKPGEKRPVVVCQHGRNDTPISLLKEIILLIIMPLLNLPTRDSLFMHRKTLTREKINTGGYIERQTQLRKLFFHLLLLNTSNL